MVRSTQTSRLHRGELAALVTELHPLLAVSDQGRGHRLAIVSAIAPWLDHHEADEVLRAVEARLGGFGEVEALLDDTTVTDILINGPGPVMVERNGRLLVSDVVLDRDGLRLLVDRLGRWCRPRPDAQRPISHGVLPSGDRATVVVAPVAVGGPHVAIRRLRSGQVALSQLAEPAVVAQLGDAIDAGLSILIIGPTGSGKTTLLAAMLALVPADERVVVLEDVAELPTAGGHVVRLESGPAADLRALVAASLRLRPDRVVVGEVRGGEALDLLHALTSGHVGGMATLHATSAPEARRRLLLLSGQASDRVDVEVVAQHWRSAFDLIVTMARQADGQRRVVDVCHFGESS